MEQGGTSPESESGATHAPEVVGVDPAILGFVSDVPVRITVEIGRAKLLVREVLQLHPGSVVELDRMTGEPADVLVNGRLVARGEITVVEDRLAVKVVEVMSSDARGREPT
jgi:flagellar motor switch protein FliN/FliY